MNYRFAVEWLKAFRDSSETVCKLYADDCLFEDLMLGQSIDNKDDLHRVFAPYANTDRTNGIGLHNFRVDSYVGDENDGVIFWSWKAEDTAAFLGIPPAGSSSARPVTPCTTTRTARSNASRPTGTPGRSSPIWASRSPRPASPPRPTPRTRSETRAEKVANS